MLSKTIAMLETYGELIKKVSKAMLLCLIFVMVFITGLQVFCRYALHSALSWPEEVNVFLMAWITFVGSSVALADNAHMGVSYFIQQFPAIVQKIVQLIGHCAIGVFLLVITFVGYDIMLEFQMVYSDALEIPMSVPRASIVVGGILMLLELVILILKDLVALTASDEGESQ